MGDEVLVKRREGRSDRSNFCAGWAAVLDLLQEFVDWRVQRHPQVPRIGLVLFLNRKRISCGPTAVSPSFSGLGVGGFSYCASPPQISLGERCSLA